MDRHKLIMKLIPDIAVPAGIYYLLRMAGQSLTMALGAAAVYSIARIGWVSITQRRLNVIGVLVGVGIVLGLVLTMITGDPQFLLARESIVSGVIGLILVGSWLIRRPILLAALKTINGSDPAAAERMDQRWQTDTGYRQSVMTITLGWGIAALLDAALRIVLILLLPLDVMAGLSVVLHLVSIGTILGWTLWYRARRRRAAVGASVVGS